MELASRAHFEFPYIPMIQKIGMGLFCFASVIGFMACTKHANTDVQKGSDRVVVETFAIFRTISSPSVTFPKTA